MAFLLVTGFTPTFGDLPGAGEDVEASPSGCPGGPSAKFLLDVLTTPPDPLSSKFTPGTAALGGDTVDSPDLELPPALLEASPALPDPELPPGDDGSVCGFSWPGFAASFPPCLVAPPDPSS